jgi:ABC-type enterochelin transport system permease subunit
MHVTLRLENGFLVFSLALILFFQLLVMNMLSESILMYIVGVLYSNILISVTVVVKYKKNVTVEVICTLLYVCITYRYYELLLGLLVSKNRLFMGRNYPPSPAVQTTHEM